MKNDFSDDPELCKYLKSCPKFGNNIPKSEAEVAEIVGRVSDLVASLHNNWGYASHFGIDPEYFNGSTMEEKGMQMRNRVIAPLFFNPENPELSPFYLYMNITTPKILRKVLANPKKYAPSGVYIMHIHGTFVNFLDLSPAIQQDIIKRLDTESTCL